MITVIREIALTFLASKLEASGDIEKWYAKTRAENPEMLLPWLVEAPDDHEHFYILKSDPSDEQLAILEVRELKSSDRRRLPFNQGTGSQSPALGPIIKRTYNKKKGPGPSAKIQNTTLESFREISSQDGSWSGYFHDALDCFERPNLRFRDEVLVAANGAYAEAIQAIDETKNTVLLAFEDANGKLPGEIPEYGQYLQGILAETKYSTSKARKVSDQTCSICGTVGDVYPNAIKGAGINFANVDRDGSFASMDVENAWKHFAACGSCADLIYVFSFHCSEDFIARVAGEKALVLPRLTGDPELRKKFMKKFRRWIASIQDKKDATITARENNLLRVFAEDQAVAELNFLWADFGQRIDNVKGVLSEVLPSRLRELSEQNLAFDKIEHPAFPENQLDKLRIRLSLGFLLELFKRPGGKKAKKENESKRLFDLRRQVVAAIYRGNNIEDTRAKVRFDDELMKTAKWHLMDMFENGHWEGLLYEGWSKKKKVAFLTFAGWVRHLAKILFYLRTIGVLPMPVAADIYKPELDSLKPFFTLETAIDSEPKAFAFLLGVLYGKVMSVQAVRGVNVGANALTWLKRLTLSGKDLPELYIKVREKLLAYETEKSRAVREIVEELGRLGSRVNDLKSLSETDACYFLLLGQSLTTTILPSKNQSN